MKDSTGKGRKIKTKNKDDNVPSHNKGCFILFIAFISKLFSFTLSREKKSDNDDPDIYPLY